MGSRISSALIPFADRLDALGIAGQLERIVDRLTGWLTGVAPGFVGATTLLIVDGFLVVVSMYYFFIDGPRLLDEAGHLSPLEPRYQREFVRELRAVAQTMIYVNLVTSLVQGVVGGLGFWLVGLPQPLAFGALMALLALVPVVGTGLVWVPAGLALVIGGRSWEGAFLLGWGLVVIGSVDNLLRPFLAKGRIGLHPLLVFVTIFGGIAAFGPEGAIIGPLVGSVFTAVMRIWKRDFVPRIGGSVERPQPPTMPEPEVAEEVTELPPLPPFPRPEAEGRPLA